MATKIQSYAIISLGGKQYLVREGERLVVDRVKTAEGKTFQPDILFVGGDGKAELAPKAAVTARVVGHVLGDKVRIGKYRPKKGYRRHTGFRAALSQIEIESIGAARKSSAPGTAAPKGEAEPRVAAAAEPPRGYPGFTVVEIGEKAKRWKLEQLEAALAYEREHANRKGAVAALESAIATKKEG
ncbi:MAG TPA: 50S ribosomal protein L21 [Gaiellaceae bacterium]|jgi:large subunit ribosomal protein L21|nr:50S ribosomal protein L21 [Gaiellaceae bacterium]